MEEDFRQTTTWRVIVLVSTIWFLSGFAQPLFVFAQEGGFLIEPLYTEVVLSENDEQKSFDIILSNRTGVDATFSVSVVDFGTLDESGGVLFLGGEDGFEKRYGLASWMRLGSEIYTVPAGESERIPVTVENRASLSPGGHYGAILFDVERNDLSASEGTTVALESSFAALVFARKAGGSIERMEYKNLEQVETDRLGIPKKAMIRFQNAGNVHLVPRGYVTVTDMRGRVVRKGVINGESGRMLPESFRVYPVSLKSIASAWLPGAYTMTVGWRFDGREEMAVVNEGRSFPLAPNIAWVIIASIPVFFIGVFLKKRSKKLKKVDFDVSDQPEGK